MHLQNYVASKGNVRHLEAAHSKALDALSLENSLDIEIRAAVIAVSAGYISTSKASDSISMRDDSPRPCKIEHSSCQRQRGARRLPLFTLTHKNCVTFADVPCQLHRYTSNDTSPRRPRHAPQTESPSDAKHFTVNGTLVNITNTLAPLWADPSRAATPDGRKALSFLLNVVSSVCVLPPEKEPVLPHLDKRLLPALGALCSAEQELRLVYPKLARIAVKAMLEEKTIRGLLKLADEVDVDVETCSSKAEMVEALLDSGKSLVTRPATASTTLLLKNASVETPVDPEMPATSPQPDAPNTGEAVPEFVSSTPSNSQKISTVHPGKPGTAPPPECASNREALSAFFESTHGPSWKNSTAWGTSAPLGEWHGVTVDDAGRVVKLALQNNKLTGAHPSMSSKCLVRCN